MGRSIFAAAASHMALGLFLSGTAMTLSAPAQAQEAAAAVRANGVPVEYVLFPDEGHGFQRRENNITASEAYLAFLNTHLRR